MIAGKTKEAVALEGFDILRWHMLQNNIVIVDG